MPCRTTAFLVRRYIFKILRASSRSYIDGWSSFGWKAALLFARFGRRWSCHMRTPQCARLVPSLDTCGTTLTKPRRNDTMTTTLWRRSQLTSLLWDIFVVRPMIWSYASLCSVLLVMCWTNLCPELQQFGRIFLCIVWINVTVCCLLSSIALTVDIYSTPVWVQSIVINPFVCLSVCLSVCEHISGTAGPIVAKFCVQISCGRGSIFLLTVLHYVMYFQFYAWCHVWP